MFKDNGHIQVNIGDLKYASGDSILKATLGSCVGLVVVDKVSKVCALAHFFLPEGKVEEGSKQLAKYVSQGIPIIIAKMQLTTREPSEFEIYVAGGSNMMSQLNSENIDNIGKLNKLKVLELLKSHNLKVKRVFNGDGLACRISVDCRTLKVSMSHIKAFEAEF